jgi:glycosyltransferase involved in cell wall biosynthesis
MKICHLADASMPNGFYRSASPLGALAARGHELRALPPSEPAAWPALLRWCDLLHIHRACDDGVVRLVQAARRSGAATVWDDDDDFVGLPRGSVARKRFGGFGGQRRLVARKRLFAELDLVTTTSERLRALCLEAGAPNVEVIENYVDDRHVIANRSEKSLVQVCWVAGKEHQLDVERIPIRAAISELLATRDEAHVTTVGINLGLEHPRYEHVTGVVHDSLTRYLAGFQLGIAPLSPDIPFNLSRSSIKLKEYAAAGVPWLASPIGPYTALGADEGGRLVADDGWAAALVEAVSGGRGRRKLAKRATAWGKSQVVSRHAERWERAFESAVARARGQHAPLR